MPRLAFRMRITALVLALALSVPWVATAAPSTGPQPAPRLLSQIWGVLANLLTAGWVIDPDGDRATGMSGAGTPVNPDAGWWIDPNGRCMPGPDAGWVIDPNG